MKTTKLSIDLKLSKAPETIDEMVIVLNGIFQSIAEDAPLDIRESLTALLCAGVLASMQAAEGYRNEDEATKLLIDIAPHLTREAKRLLDGMKYERHAL